MKKLLKLSAIFILVAVSMASYGQQPNLWLEGNVSTNTTFDDGFEDVNLPPFTSGGNASWLVQSAVAYAGTFAAQSGTILDNQSTFIRYITSVTEPSTLSFAVKVSSEENFDFLSFEVNGSELLSVSGEKDWQVYTFDLGIGTDTLEWTYSKNGSMSSGSDASWLDSVIIQYISGQVLQISDGLQAAGKLLISDANGKAAWASPNKIFDDKSLPLVLHKDMPYGAYGPEDAAPLIVENKLGAGIRIRQADVGIRVDSTTNDGFQSYNAGGFGFYSRNAGNDGFYSLDAGDDGFVSWSAGDDGFYSSFAGDNGFASTNAGDNGFASTNAGDNGFLSIDADTFGFFSTGAGTNGFTSLSAEVDGFYSRFDGRYGFFSQYAGGDGFFSSNSGGNGFYSLGAGASGFYSLDAGFDGFYSKNAGRYGFYSFNAVDDGFYSQNSGDHGFYSLDAGSNGFRSLGSGASGFVSSFAGTNGFYSTSSVFDGFHSFNAGDDGFYSSGAVGDGFRSFNAGVDGFYSQNSGGYAGYFSGEVHVNGNLSKAAGSFKIDHPLDPENKFLYHSFVESPDMMNVYNGNIITDADGIAVVGMPEWFDVLNRDFRYQLTVIGIFAQAIVKEEVSGNQFVIQTDQPLVKVSWQITGIRQDRYANQNRIEVEVEKPAKFKGYYLHPEAYDMPFEKGFDFVKNDHKTLAELHEKGKHDPSKEEVKNKEEQLKDRSK